MWLIMYTTLGVSGVQQQPLLKYTTQISVNSVPASINNLKACSLKQEAIQFVSFVSYHRHLSL